MNKNDKPQVTTKINWRHWRQKRALGDRVSLTTAGIGLGALATTAGVGYLALKRKQNKAKLNLLSR